MTFDYAAQRLKMVDGQLRTTDVTNVAVLEAMLAVPREEFVPANRRQLAYIDEDIEIAPATAEAPGRYLMEPSPFAKLLQLAEISKNDVVLDVGAGTGYSSAILSRLAGSVIALESDADLAASANRTLAGLDADNVAVVEGPLENGHPAEAPYDVIIVEGAVEEMPEKLFEQLSEGGRLVAVVGHGNTGTAMVFLKENGIVAHRRGFNCAIKPLAAFRRAPSFQF